MCLQGKRKSEKWYLDSGCSRHMTGNKSMFLSLRAKEGGSVTFRDNFQGKIVGIGKIGKHSLPSIDNVLLVEGLKHNLLSISQLCDSGFHVSFNKDSWLVKDVNNDTTLFTVKRQNNLYKVDLEDLSNQNVTCLVSMKDEKWIWHKRLGHANMKLLSKLAKNDLVRGLPKIKFEKDAYCEACQRAKQTAASSGNMRLLFNFLTFILIRNQWNFDSARSLWSNTQ
uniref:Uncharacterized protein n=1 Tax=Ammopiptanthus mongolicus TaxID=126911 RepID=A0A4P8PGW9_AMMMO|nr:hypothetical protein [Ammopiptanthus mongolicus]